MFYAVLFEDDPKADPEIRGRHMDAHLSYLTEKRDAVQAAGPLLEADGSPAGGLWLVEAENAEEVDRLVRADPFWPTGLRKSVRIVQWRQVFRDGARLV